MRLEMERLKIEARHSQKTRFSANDRVLGDVCNQYETTCFAEPALSGACRVPPSPSGAEIYESAKTGGGSIYASQSKQSAMEAGAKRDAQPKVKHGTHSLHGRLEPD